MNDVPFSVIRAKGRKGKSEWRKSCGKGNCPWCRGSMYVGKQTKKTPEKVGTSTFSGGRVS
jgi:hypothetical protein